MLEAIIAIDDQVTSIPIITILVNPANEHHSKQTGIQIMLHEVR